MVCTWCYTSTHVSMQYVYWRILHAHYLSAAHLLQLLIPFTQYHLTHDANMHTFKGDTASHEQFAAVRSRAYVPKMDMFKKLDNFAEDERDRCACEWASERERKASLGEEKDRVKETEASREKKRTTWGFLYTLSPILYQFVFCMVTICIEKCARIRVRVLTQRN